MLFVSFFVLLVLYVANIDADGASYGKSWDYKVNGAMGPSKWKVHNKHCGDNAQSPINILTKDVQHNKDLGLQLHDYNQIGGNTTFKMHNRNTDIGFLAKSKNKHNPPQSVTFKGTKYRFYQFHFHWGSESFQGSEHLLDWQRSAAELHMIHQNTKYPNISMAVDKSDGLLVWGHFLKVNSKNNVENYQFQKLLDQFSKVKSCCSEYDVDVNLFKLLPKEHRHFYTYQGGLTTPPCYESVRWVVNRSPILISEKQMAIFRTLKDQVNGGQTLQDNFRPTQPLNGRIVESNFDPAEVYAIVESAGVAIAPCFLTMLTVLAAVIFTY